MPNDIEQLKKRITELETLVGRNLRPGEHVFTKNVRFDAGAKILGGVYPLGFNSNGTTIFAPAGWSVVHSGTGVYQVTHPLNTTRYFPVGTVDSTGKAANGQIVTIQNLTTTTFDVVTVDFGNAQIDDKVYLLIMLY